MRHSSSLLYSFILLVLDFLALVTAFALAYILRVKLDDRPLLEPITAWGYIAVIAVLLVFWLFIFGMLGLYKSHVYENRFKEFSMLFVGSFIGILFLIGSEYALNRAIFPARLVTAYGFMFAFLLSLLLRTIARASRRSLFTRGVGISNVLLIGNSSITGEMVHALSDIKNGFRVVGVIGDLRKKYPHIDTSIQYKNFAAAAQHIQVSDIHSIVQTELSSDPDFNNEILAFAQKNHIAYRFVPGSSKMFLGKIDVELFNNIPTVAVHQTALTGWGRIGKRLFDIIFGIIIIIVLSPVFIVAYIIAKLMAPREPVLFTQTRLTRFNQPFDIYKFRSQYSKYDGTTPEQAFTQMGRPELIAPYRKNGDSIPNDPRITPFGKIARAISLDELPQLFSVVKGELSLVGPRPLIPEELDLFDKKNIILSVKPGITGLAVISGRRNISFEERRKLDMYYAQNWSFWMDITILLKTVVLVIRKVGAK